VYTDIDIQSGNYAPSPMNAPQVTSRQEIQGCSWHCKPGYVEDEIRKICKICTHECVVGQYISECTSETQWEGCSPCSKPSNSTFTGPGRSFPNSCPWVCDANLVYQNLQCVEVDAPISISTPNPCSLSPDDCNIGQIPDMSDCTCVACVTPSNVSFAQFTQRGNCEWVCSHPYIRSNGLCVRLLDLTNRLNRIDPTNQYDDATILLSANSLQGAPADRRSLAGPLLSVTSLQGAPADRRSLVKPVADHPFWRHTQNGGVGVDSGLLLAGVIPFLVILVGAMMFVLRY
jgi:hypothetical protein